MWNYLIFRKLLYETAVRSRKVGGNSVTDKIMISATITACYLLPFPYNHAKATNFLLSTEKPIAMRG